MPLRLDTSSASFDAEFAALVAAKRETDADVDAAVAAILAAVKARGDAAVIDYTRRFDKLELTPETMRIPPGEIAAGGRSCDAETLKALRLAAERIEAYHRRQLPQDLDYVDVGAMMSPPGVVPVVIKSLLFS